MKTLLERIQEINTANAAWMQEDPTNRWAGKLIEDLNHWSKYGITTPDQFDQYLDSCAAHHGVV